MIFRYGWLQSRGLVESSVMDPKDKDTQIDDVRSFSRVHQKSQIEVVLVHVHPDSKSTGPWRSLEFWTANTMYGFDANLVCIEVNSRDPRSGQVPTHLLGSLLVGSQSREKNDYSISFPYPVPGMEAVLRVPNQGKHMTTSAVERVMLRVRITNLAIPDGSVPDWANITTQWEPGS
jgi:hypothetical protein